MELHERPPAAELQDDVDKVLVFEKGVELDDVLVGQGLVERYLLGHLVPLMRLLQQGLGHNLAGDDVAIGHVLQLVHLGETALQMKEKKRSSEMKQKKKAFFANIT